MQWVMALPTLDRQDCGAFPPDHSVEDHLEAERAALDADLRAATVGAAGAEAGRPDRWMLVRAAGLGLALAGTIAFGLGRLHERDDAPACPTPSSQSADAPTGADGCR